MDRTTMTMAVLCLLLGGCGGDDGGDGGVGPGGPGQPGGDGDDGGDGTGGDGTTSDTTCPVGYPGCPCAPDSVCNGALVCNEDDNICEEPPDDGGDDPICPAGTLGCPCEAGDICNEEGVVCDEETGICVPEPGNDCTSNSDCDTDEVCFEDGCVETDALYFRTVVLDFVPPTCDDGWGTKELYFDYIHGGDWELTSPTVGCPASWGNFPIVYDSLKTFELGFWEEDGLYDDPETKMCWEEAGTCHVVPDATLRAGGYDGEIGGTDYLVEITFEPCGYYPADPRCE